MDDSNRTICKFYHLGCGPAPKIGRKSAYFRAWVIANGGKLPRRGASMAARKFVGHVFSCEVRDVVRTLEPATQHPKEAIYSTVAKLLELCA
jgi:hypothetical protein